MKGKRVHLVGIGGSGMSAIARILLARGTEVTGSELARTPIVEQLEREGARVAIGQRAENVAGADLVVCSSAVAATNPERVAAKEAGIEIVGRGSMLARLIGTTPCIAVAGTHGKSTTTAMIATILEHAGLDPTVAVGAVRVDTGSNARSGDGRWFVTESDESDLSFLELRPTLAVVTNVENDHVADDTAMKRMVAAFERFVSSVDPSGTIALGIDSPPTAALRIAAQARVRTFALRVPADVEARDVQFDGFESSFTLTIDGSERARVTLHVPGAINVANALAAAALADACGIDAPAIAGGLSAYRGVQRRFDVLLRTPALTVVDDYAHHPTAVAQTIAAARAATAAPLIVAFQPHRYTRTSYLATDFARALGAADRVYLTPIYAASEPAIDGVSERSIGEPLAASGTPVTYPRLDDLPETILREVPKGAVVLVLGAGSITNAAHRLAALAATAPALA